MNRLLGEGFSNQEIEPIIDPRWQVLKREASTMVDEARKVAITARSWRNFRVGAAGLGFDMYGNHDRMWGANNSPEPGSPKSCAEMNVMDFAESFGYKLYAMAISGPPQEDQTSKFNSPTLHSCGACRMKFADIVHESGVVDSNTILICAAPLRSVFEIYTVQEMLDIHNHPNTSEENPKLRVYGSPFNQVASLVEALADFGDKHPEIAHAQPPDVTLSNSPDFPNS